MFFPSGLTSRLLHVVSLVARVMVCFLPGGFNTSHLSDFLASVFTADLSVALLSALASAGALAPNTAKLTASASGVLSNAIMVLFVLLYMRFIQTCL